MVWGVGLVAVALISAAALAFLHTAYFRAALVSYIASRTDRDIRVGGALDAHFLSSSPSLTAEDVTIGNPSWMPPGVTARIGKLTLVFDFPLPWRKSSVQRLEMAAATLHLVRDADGRANWQPRAPGTLRHGQGHLVRSLSIPDARVEIDDARRHLQFTGIVSAGDVAAPGGVDESRGGEAPVSDARGAAAPPPLRIAGKGQLNGRAAEFTITGDPLSTVARDRPYAFSFTERSGDSRLSGSGHLIRPFDPGMLDTTFDAAGPSMRELYFLVGISLPETAPFSLAGTLARRGPRSEFRDLRARFGKSDARGSVVLHVVDGRRRFDADVRSGLLRLSDLGRHEPDGSTVPHERSNLLLPDNHLPFGGLRNKGWVVRYQADSIEMSSLSLHRFATNFTVDEGVLTAPRSTAAFEEAHLEGSVKIDARDDVPRTDLDLKIEGLQLSRFARKPDSPPPFDGALRARVQVTGRGNSVHELAASANGRVTAVVPHGAMRASLAESTGMSLHALGLVLVKSQRQAVVRCAVASFKAENGTLSAERFFVDTDPTLIHVTGAIRLDNEALDLTLRGQPRKTVVLRLHTPIYMTGSLRHPEFRLRRESDLTKAGEAVALADSELASEGECAEKLVATSMPRDRKTAKGVTESAKRASRRREEN